VKVREFELGSAPAVLFHGCAGDGTVQGWDKSVIQLTSEAEASVARLHPLDNRLEISGLMPLSAHLPTGSSTELSACNGDIVISRVQSVQLSACNGDWVIEDCGDVVLQDVQGDIMLKQSRSVQVKQFRGDLVARGIEADATIANAHGDLAIERATGNVSIHDVHGDISISGTPASAEVQAVRGDLTFSGAPTRGNYVLQVRGDIILRLDETSSVRLELHAPSGDIRCSLPGAERSSADDLAARIGEGAAVLTATAQDGSIRVVTGASTEQGQATQAELGGEAIRLVHRLEQFKERVRRESQRVTDAFRAERSRRVYWGPSRDAAPDEAEDLEKERLTVLGMLGDGQITAEQAETLLRALE